MLQGNPTRFVRPLNIIICLLRCALPIRLFRHSLGPIAFGGSRAPGAHYRWAIGHPGQRVVVVGLCPFGLVFMRCAVGLLVQKKTNRVTRDQLVTLRLDSFAYATLEAPLLEGLPCCCFVAICISTRHDAVDGYCGQHGVGARCAPGPRSPRWFCHPPRRH